MQAVAACTRYSETFTLIMDLTSVRVTAEQSVVDQANYQVDFNRDYFSKFFPPVCVADGEVPSI